MGSSCRCRTRPALWSVPTWPSRRRSLPRTQGLQTNYLAPGNQVGAAALSGQKTFASYFWLNAVDVASPAAAQAAQGPRVIVAFGDSITDGANSSRDENMRWPNRLDDRLRSSARRVPAQSVVNAGLAGNRWLHAGVGPSGQSRFDRDVLRASAVTDAVIMMGINDIGIGQLYPPQRVTAEQLIAAVQQAADQAKRAGLRVYLGTLPPFAGAGYYTEEGEAVRQALNHFIRTARGVHGVIDFDQAVRDPARSGALDSRFDSGDHLHLNDAGYDAMAEAAFQVVKKA